MFAYIKGSLEQKSNNYVVIDVGGIGYKIFMATKAIETLGEIGKVVKVVGGFGVLRKTIFSPSVLIAIIVTLFLFGLAFNKKKDESFMKLIIGKFRFLLKKNKEEFKELENDKPPLEIKKVDKQIDRKVKEIQEIEDLLFRIEQYKVENNIR